MLALQRQWPCIDNMHRVHRAKLGDMHSFPASEPSNTAKCELWIDWLIELRFHVQLNTNRLFRQIAWPQNPTQATPRIKQLVASYHTTKVIAHRKIKVVAMATSVRCRLWAIPVFCRPTTQTPSTTNRLVTIIRTKPVNNNFNPKIGCHGNDP